MTAPPSIQNQLLDITVVGCSNLPQPWGGITANHPYINLLYGSEIFRTRICLGGGENPKFADEFKIQLIEGIRKIKVEVMNSNSFGADNIIGYGKIYLHKVLHVGYDSKTWPLLSKSFRQAGELKVIMHYENVEKHILPNLPCPRCLNYIHEDPPMHNYSGNYPGLHLSSDRDLVPQPNLQHPTFNSSQLQQQHSAPDKDFVPRPSASTGNMLSEQEKVDRRWENLKYYSQIRDFNHVM